MPFEGDIQKHTAPPVVENEAQRLIREARERLPTPQSWCKTFFERNGAHCILGAFGDSPENYWAAPTTALLPVVRAIHDLGYGRRSHCREFATTNKTKARTIIASFNNNHDTHHKHVLAVLDRAYELAAAS